MPPKISVLIATDLHAPQIDAFFDSLLRQTLAPTEYEVVIIDTCHQPEYGPGHARAMQKSNGVRLRFERIERGGRAKAYNHGIRQSTAPVILFMGADMIVMPQTVEAHLRFHERDPDPRRTATGPVVFDELHRTPFADWLEQSGELFGVPTGKHVDRIPDDFFTIANSSVKRALVVEAGSFDEAFPFHSWDDYELGVRMRMLGMRASFIPGATVVHDHRVSLADRCKSMYEAGMSARIFMRKHPGNYPWQDKLRKSVWRYRYEAWTSKVLHLLHGRDEHLIAYYRARLDGSFTAGYQRGMTADGAAVTFKTNIGT